MHIISELIVVLEQQYTVEVVDGLNATEKQFLSMLIRTVHLPISEDYDSYMATNTATVNTYIILVREFQKHNSDPT